MKFSSKLNKEVEVILEPTQGHSASCKISLLLDTGSRDAASKFLLSQTCLLYFMHYKDVRCKERKSWNNGSLSYPVSDFASSTMICFEVEITDNNIKIDGHYHMRLIIEQV